MILQDFSKTAFVEGGIPVWSVSVNAGGVFYFFGMKADKVIHLVSTDGRLMTCQSSDTWQEYDLSEYPEYEPFMTFRRDFLPS